MSKEEKRKTGCTCKSPSSAVPSGISRNRRMVALCWMSRHIAGGRLRRFNIHPHIHGYPRAAKAYYHRNVILLYATLYEFVWVWQWNLFWYRAEKVNKDIIKGKKKRKENTIDLSIEEVIKEETIRGIRIKKKMRFIYRKVK